MSLYLTEDEVVCLLDMPSAIEAVRRVMDWHGRGLAVNHPRQRIRRNGTILHWMGSAVSQWGLTGFKVYSEKSALFFLYGGDGRLLAVMSAVRLGQIRTGAASAVASRLMARPDSRRIAIIGAGFQAETQVLALCHTFSVDQIFVFSRTEERRNAFCQRLAEATGSLPIAVSDPADAVGKADIVVTVTTSAHPVLMGRWLRPGTHINAVGANSVLRRELDGEAVDRCQRIVVDDRVQSAGECGDLLASVERGRFSWSDLPQLGQVVSGQLVGRDREDEITLFDSHGIALWDLAVAKLIYERALEKGLGTPLPFR